jgi:molecular chaperone GrpE
MSAGEANNNGGSDGRRPGSGSGGGTDLSDEIDRTMAEAEAAVSSMGGAPGDEEGASGNSERIEIVDDDPPAANPEAELQARVAELEAQVAATKDKWIRAVADLENHKKRVRREVDEAKVRTAQSILPPFLSVMDNLERALEVAAPAVQGASDDNDENVQQLVAGIEMVRKEFIGALAKNGILPVEAVGRPFDPAEHDALQQMDSPDHAPGVVMREFEKGWKMGERLLRPARVIVAGAGSTGAPPEGSETDEQASEGSNAEN